MTPHVPKADHRGHRERSHPAVVMVPALYRVCLVMKHIRLSEYTVVLNGKRTGRWPHTYQNNVLQAPRNGVVRTCIINIISGAGIEQSETRNLFNSILSTPTQ